MPEQREGVAGAREKRKEEKGISIGEKKRKKKTSHCYENRGVGL